MMKSLTTAWNRFFFVEQSPAPIALFRIAYGTAVIATLWLLRPDWLAWYGPDAWISGFFWVFLGSAILLTVGFLSRINSAIVFLCLTSIQQRNLFITHGG